MRDIAFYGGLLVATNMATKALSGLKSYLNDDAKKSKNGFINNAIMNSRAMIAWVVDASYTPLMFLGYAGQVALGSVVIDKMAQDYFSDVVKQSIKAIAPSTGSGTGTNITVHNK